MLDVRVQSIGRGFAIGFSRLEFTQLTSFGGTELAVLLLLNAFHDAFLVWFLPESISRLILIRSYIVNYQAPNGS
jgi:hypothetical protein